jgi:serine/threonine-protein kinase
MAVTYTIRGASFVPDKPRPWNPVRLATMGSLAFDLVPDGERVVALLPADAPESRETLKHVTLMLNFPDEFRRRLQK